MCSDARLRVCRQDTFPQTYLGLPLSSEMLRLTAFAPLIARTERYLPGWAAALLNHHACCVLVNSVLDNLPTYLMCALEIPRGIENQWS